MIPKKQWKRLISTGIDGGLCSYTPSSFICETANWKIVGDYGGAGCYQRLYAMIQYWTRAETRINKEDEKVIPLASQDVFYESHSLQHDFSELILRTSSIRNSGAVSVNKTANEAVQASHNAEAAYYKASRHHLIQIQRVRETIIWLPIWRDRTRE